MGGGRAQPRRGRRLHVRRRADSWHGPVDGLVFWAAYPVADLSDRDDLAVASISGSEDGFSTPQDIADARDLLPADTTYTEIEGAIHAFFGDYGDQPGDGTPTISREDGPGADRRGDRGAAGVAADRPLNGKPAPSAHRPRAARRRPAGGRGRTGPGHLGGGGAGGSGITRAT